MGLRVGATRGPARGTRVGLGRGEATPKFTPLTRGRGTDTAVTRTIPTATATTNPAMLRLIIQTSATPVTQATHTATGICRPKL